MRTSRDSLVLEKLVGHIEAVFLVEERPNNEREILKCITAMILGDTAFAQHAYFDAMDHYRKANAHAQKAMAEEFSWQTAYRIAKTNERLDRKAEALKRDYRFYRWPKKSFAFEHLSTGFLQG